MPKASASGTPFRGACPWPLSTGGRGRRRDPRLPSGNPPGCARGASQQAKNIGELFSVEKRTNTANPANGAFALPPPIMRKPLRMVATQPAGLNTQRLMLKRVQTPVPSVERRVSGVECRASGVECRASSVECRASGVGCRVSRERTPVLCPPPLGPRPSTLTPANEALPGEKTSPLPVAAPFAGLRISDFGLRISAFLRASGTRAPDRRLWTAAPPAPRSPLPAPRSPLHVPAAPSPPRARQGQSNRIPLNPTQSNQIKVKKISGGPADPGILHAPATWPRAGSGKLR
jgi:hypothetical protein